MTRSASLAIVVLLAAFAAVPVEAGDQPGKNKKHRGGRPTASAETTILFTFTTAEIGVLRRHYAPRFANLPHGLQKKLARGGSLPPGWQTKVEPFPVALERGLRPLPAGYSRGVIDAHAVIYRPNGTIIDVAVLF